MKEKLLTTREVSQILGVTEREVIELANSNAVPHYKVAGEFLRFKKEDISNAKRELKSKFGVVEPEYQKLEWFKNFFYFNDFYIIGGTIIIFLLWIVFKDFPF